MTPGEWKRFLRREEIEEVVDLIRRRTRTGRPCGQTRFVRRMEEKSGRVLSARPRGRPPGRGEKR